MSTAEAPHHIDPDLIGAGDRIVPGRIDDRRFALCVVVALALHAALLINVNSGTPKRLGAEGGADDAISVSIITERDFKGQATVEDRAAGPLRPTMPPAPADTRPAPAPTQQPAPPAAPPPAEAPADAATAAAPEQARATAPPADTAGPAAKSQTAKTEEPGKTREDTKEANKRPAPAKKPTEPKAAPSATAETAKLTPPAIFQAPAGGGGAGVQRPAGITRSGENDDFARGVIRALQTTMPQLRNTYGRVTVRITLDMKGDLVGTVVIKPSGVGGLDQSVVFATRQSSFPFPPRNAVPADLVFFVTYIYR